MAPVVNELRSRPDSFEVLICATAQQREMTDQMQDLFGLSSDFDLDLMRAESETQTSCFLKRYPCWNDLLSRVSPDWVLVQGDTTTVLAATTAAFHLGIKIGHVEAGLRTRDLRLTFPRGGQPECDGPVCRTSYSHRLSGRSNSFSTKVGMKPRFSSLETR